MPQQACRVRCSRQPLSDFINRDAVERFYELLFEPVDRQPHPLDIFHDIHPQPPGLLAERALGVQRPAKRPRKYAFLIAPVRFSVDKVAGSSPVAPIFARV